MSERKGGKIELDADDYLDLLDELSDIESKLRALGSKGFKLSTPRESPRDSTESKPIKLDLYIDDIQWTLPKSQGGGPAGKSAHWSWAFGYDQSGAVRRETEEIVAAVLRYGKVQVGSFIVELGGRDNRLLNRRRVS